MSERYSEPRRARIRGVRLGRLRTAGSPADRLPGIQLAGGYVDGDVEHEGRLVLMVMWSMDPYAVAFIRNPLENLTRRTFCTAKGHFRTHRWVGKPDVHRSAEWP